MSVVGGKLHSELKNARVIRPINEWITSTNGKIRSGMIMSSKSYEKGFHIFETENAACRWGVGSYQQLRKVQYRKMVASGSQNNDNVVVAKEIKILER